MVQLFGLAAMTITLLVQAHPADAAPVRVEYALTGGNQFPGPGFEGLDPLVSPGGAIASGSLIVTLYAAGCSTPPGTGSSVCLRNFEFLSTQGQSFGVANRVLEDVRHRRFAAGVGNSSVTVADLDGDTVPDVITVDWYSDAVSVLMGSGNASFFQPAVSFAAGDATSVAVADLDADTIPDFVTANTGSWDVSVLMGNGDGSFQEAASFAAGLPPSYVAVADLDGDTVPDVVTASHLSADVSVLLGNGDGSFHTVPLRGPGLAVNLRALHDYQHGFGPFTLEYRQLNIIADEAGRLGPIGTRTPFFTHRSSYCDDYMISCSQIARSGTFIVGQEVLTGVPMLLPGAHALLLLGLGLSVPGLYLLRRPRVCGDRAGRGSPRRRNSEARVPGRSDSAPEVS